MHNLNDPPYVSPFIYCMYLKIVRFENRKLHWNAIQFFAIKPFSQLMKQQISISQLFDMIFYWIYLK